MREGTQGLLLQGNYIHDLTRGGEFAGYAIRVAGSYGPITDTVIRSNTIARTQEDGIMLVSQVRNTVIDSNLVTGVFPSDGSHAVPMMLQDAYGISVRNNRFIGNSQPVYFNDGLTGLNFTNNLIVKGDNWCIQMGAIGSDAAEGVKNATIRFKRSGTATSAESSCAVTARATR